MYFPPLYFSIFSLCISISVPAEVSLGVAAVDLSSRKLLNCTCQTSLQLLGPSLLYLLPLSILLLYTLPILRCLYPTHILFPILLFIFLHLIPYSYTRPKYNVCPPNLLSYSSIVDCGFT